MTQNIEIAELDLRYEGFRMKNPALERKLLGSIQQRGIEEPLSGVDPGQSHILLDGFKRLRCARILGLHGLPYSAQGQDQALGIMNMLRGSGHQPLLILEQACFIDELRALHGLSVSEIAQQLARSKGWVSMRLGLFEELTPAVREKLFAGQFPVYAYLYTVRPFMRMNKVPAERIEQFVLAVSGKGLSVREIAFLFQRCFGSSPAWREQILQGRLELPLRHYRQDFATPGACDSLERGVLRDLELAEKLMRRVAGVAHENLKSPAFQAQANLLTTQILKEAQPFLQQVRLLHARTESA
jgi:hypothetical protein